jgi:dihydrolipoamide dehydrogenase
MAHESTQLAVLGAGPGGYAAAFYAADLGMQVALIDEAPNPGGVCLYRGCIPSKALLHVAKVMDEARHASAWGVVFGEPTVDVDTLRSFKQGIVDKLTAGVGQVAKLRKVKFLQGRASLTGPHSMTIAGSAGQTELQFEHCVLATGSHPTRIPSLALDTPRMMDSTSALDVPDVPQSLLVIGGGYIGLELGSVYATLGSKVSLVEMTPGLLPGAVRRCRQRRAAGSTGTGVRPRARRRRPAAELEDSRTRFHPGENRRQRLHRNRRPAAHG